LPALIKAINRNVGGLFLLCQFSTGIFKIDWLASPPRCM
jgi:hypothetical protein